MVDWALGDDGADAVDKVGMAEVRATEPSGVVGLSGIVITGMVAESERRDGALARRDSSDAIVERISSSTDSAEALKVPVIARVQFR